MGDNPLLRLESFGQSIWMDLVRRGMLDSGELRRLIEEDGIRGVTSNPSIFEKAIAGSHDYDDAIRALALEGKSVQEAYEALTVEDIQQVANLFRPTYNQLDGKDGFISLEVSPHLAHDTAGTIAEARRLWAAVDHPNAMIKVPATREGLPAIRQLISEGINVNVTLLFGLPRYREVTEAYMAGLEARAAQNKPIKRAASVASFFLSRIDTLVDPLLEKIMSEEGPKAALAASLRGQTAIASAQAAFQIYQDIIGGERFRRLVAQGARPQRLLWASTSTKNPTYSDVKYVEALIGPETINTLPLETLTAYRNHGDPALRLTEGISEAFPALERLRELGIDLASITQRLEDEGVDKFIQSFKVLMHTLEEKCAAALKERVDRQVFDLGHDKINVQIQDRIALLEKEHWATRLWRKDASLWSGSAESQQAIGNALGWLHVAEKMEENLHELSEFVADVKVAGFRRVLHMGMGGSSLTPLVFQQTFTPDPGALAMTVLDTTDPATILAVEREHSMAETLFIVASKSGATAEPLAFGDYFYQKLGAIKGDRAGQNFVAITDPGTPLVKLAQERGFRKAWLNFADIGGRYSALSYFGLVPAALMGINTPELLVRALRMEHACASCVSARQNPGILLGAAMGELARRGRNKVTFVMPKSIASLGMWLEQLLAESTGKVGAGLLPVANEPLGDPSVYGGDRLFIYIRLEGEVDEASEHRIAALRDAGQPVVVIEMHDRLDLAQEFFRWEIATAVAGSILRINAFDQPNVQESKDNTNRLIEMCRRNGKLPEEKPTLVKDGLSLFTEEAAPTLNDALRQFLARARSDDYIALMAYLTEDANTTRALQAIRLLLRDRLHVATTLGYGPRLLHSTGQYHKGGPNTGVFLQLTADNSADAQVPGQPYTFGALTRAQALGDLEALRKHGRRVMRVHLGADISGGLQALGKALQAIMR